MLETPSSPVSDDVLPYVSASSRAQWCRRAAALAAAAGGLLLWPRDQAGYGVAFWLWAGGVVGYALSFPRAWRPFAPPARGVILGLCAILALAGVLRLVALEAIPANIS